jgi:hypothetical protein
MRGTPWSSGSFEGQLWRVMRNPSVKTIPRESAPAKNRQQSRRFFSPRGKSLVKEQSSKNNAKQKTSTNVRNGTATSPKQNLRANAAVSRRFVRQKGLNCSSSSSIVSAGYVGLNVGKGVRGDSSETWRAGCIKVKSKWSLASPEADDAPTIQSRSFEDSMNFRAQLKPSTAKKTIDSSATRVTGAAAAALCRAAPRRRR